MTVARFSNERVHAALLLVSAAIAMVAAPLAAAEERMRAGLWELTTTQGGRPINSGNHCVKPEEAASANADSTTMRAALQTSFAKADCALKDLTVTANTLTYAVECGSGATAHTISSTSKYHGDTFEAELISKGEGLNSATSTKGRRIGACP